MLNRFLNSRLGSISFFFFFFFYVRKEPDVKEKPRDGKSLVRGTTYAGAQAILYAYIVARIDL